MVRKVCNQQASRERIPKEQIIDHTWTFGFRNNAVDPGLTATDLNGHRGYQTVEEGTDVIVQLATIDKNGPTGTFMDRRGIVPW